MSPPAFVAWTGAIVATASNGATFTPTISNGAIGDLLILCIWRGSAQATPDLSASGWTTISGGTNVDSTNAQSVATYWKRATSATGTADQIAVTFGTSTVVRGGLVIRISGTDTVTPIHNATCLPVAATATTVGSTNFVATPADTLGVFIAAVGGRRASNNTTTNWPDAAGVTTFSSDYDTAGNDMTIGFGCKQFAPASSDYLTPAITWSGNTTTGSGFGILLSIRETRNRTATPVTCALSQVWTNVSRTAAPVDCSLSQTLTSTATPVDCALSVGTGEVTRTATPVSAALSQTATSVASPVTVSLSSGAGTIARTATPVTAVLGFSLGASTDEGAWTANTFYSANPVLGHQTNGFWNGYASAFFRFPSVTVPTGATITSAVLTIYAGEFAESATTHHTIRAEAADNPATPTSIVDANGRTRTTAGIAFDSSGNWFARSTRTTSDLSSVIQELVDRPAWSSGNAMLLLFDVDGDQPTDNLRNLSTFVADPAYRPVLVITYSASGTRTATPVTAALAVASAERTATATPITASLQLARRARVSWLDFEVPAAGGVSTITRTATPVTTALSLSRRTATPVTAALSGVSRITAPLVVGANSHWFVDPSTGRAVMLAGSHTWNTTQDTDTSTAPATITVLDFDAYVTFLKSHGHNCTILWHKDLPTYYNWNGGTWRMTPWPWARNGGSNASDGQPQFDFNTFNQSFFDRIRDRANTLLQNNIYAIVELFDGLGLVSNRGANDGYPFTSGNNVNSVSDGGGTGSMTMVSANAISAIQDAYVQKMIDTLNDLPNVIWEINEEAPAGSDTWWAGHMIDLIHTYEASQGYALHPVLYPTTNGGDLGIWSSAAEAIAPIGDGAGFPYVEPTNNQGYVLISDGDHSAWDGATGWTSADSWWRGYLWENVCHGASVLFMDPYLVYWGAARNINVGSHPNGIGQYPDTRWDNFRNNLGAAASYGSRMNLAAMTPQNSLASTTYCLANTSAGRREWLAYAPSGGAFTVDLSSASGVPIAVEWFNPATLAYSTATAVSGGSATQSFTPPWGSANDAVLYLAEQASVATPVTAALSKAGSTRTATPVTASLSTTRTKTATPVSGALTTTRTKTATPISSALLRSAPRTATPVTGALQSLATRTATPISGALTRASTRSAVPVSVALLSTRPTTATPVTCALSGGGLSRTASPMTAALRRTTTRTATPVAAALQATRSRSATPVTLSSYWLRAKTATSVSAALRSTLVRTASPVTCALSGGLAVTRTATPVVASLRVTTARSAAPVSAALSAINSSRTATPTSAALSKADQPRMARPVTAALSGGGLTRTASPVSASLRATATSLATPVTTALQATSTRTAGPVTGSLVWIRTRTATPVTTALSGAAVRWATPVSASLRDTLTVVATPISAALSTTATRTSTHVTASTTNVRMLVATPVTAAILSGGEAVAHPVTAALFLRTMATASPITASIQLLILEQAHFFTAPARPRRFAGGTRPRSFDSGPRPRTFTPEAPR